MLNERDIRAKWKNGWSCEEAVRDTAYAKMLARFEFTRLVTRPDCAANDIEVTLGR